MKDLDKELQAAYDEGYRVGYLSLCQGCRFGILDDLHKEWTRGREDGRRDREERIKLRAVCINASTPTTGGQGEGGKHEQH